METWRINKMMITILEIQTRYGTDRRIMSIIQIMYTSLVNLINVLILVVGNVCN